MPSWRGGNGKISTRRWLSWVRRSTCLPVPGLPDLVFTANAGLVFRDLFLPSRFRFGVRQGESEHFEDLGASPWVYDRPAA